MHNSVFVPACGIKDYTETHSVEDLFEYEVSLSNVELQCTSYIKLSIYDRT